jgi:hypothetical protein
VASPEDEITPQVRALLGQVRYLEAENEWFLRLLQIAVGSALRCPFCGQHCTLGHAETCEYVVATHDRKTP